MADLSQEFLDQVGKELKRRQNEFLQKKEDLIKSDPVRDPDRLIDNAADDDSREDQGHEQMKALVAEIDLQLEEIKLAIKKLSRGSYGKCEVCGREIHQDRLRLMPWALSCITCEKSV